MSSTQATRRRRCGHFTPRTSFDDVVGLSHFFAARPRQTMDSSGGNNIERSTRMGWHISIPVVSLSLNTSGNLHRLRSFVYLKPLRIMRTFFAIRRNSAGSIYVPTYWLLPPRRGKTRKVKWPTARMSSFCSSGMGVDGLSVKHVSCLSRPTWKSKMLAEPSLHSSMRERDVSASTSP